MKRKNFKRVKGVVSADWLKKYGDSPNRSNLLLEAMSNPDVLSDENGLYQERDYDAEIDREIFAKKVAKAFELLTERQKEVVNALRLYDTQEEAAKSLGIKQSSLAMTLIQIQKKILKLIDKDPNKEQRI